MGLHILRMTRSAARASVAAAVALGVIGLASAVGADTPAKDAGAPRGAVAKGGGEAAKQPPVKLGLSVNDPRAYQGYTLFAPLFSKTTYLIDMEGKVVKTWKSEYSPGAVAYLLENGHLLRAGAPNGLTHVLNGGGAGGHVQEFSWDGELVWDFKLINDKQRSHHDVLKLPSGNVLIISWDKKTTGEAVAAGRKKELVGNSHLQPDSLIEVKPTGKTTGEVVWEWHLWDHLVQDQDSSRANFGDVAAHPELVDINYYDGAIAKMMTTKDGIAKLKAIGYLANNAATPKTPQKANADWTHFNGLSYNPELDQVMVSVHGFSEIWIIDHSTTTAEAAGHTGGKSGKGGDLLYRWGNPGTYRAGTVADQKLFSQHNAQWIAPGLPGAGHVLVFNNGMRRPGKEQYSSVDELVLPVDAKGNYSRKPGPAYGPDKPAWSYTAPKKPDFFSSFISGAHRLPNGDTMICSGANGTFIEVTPDKEIVWKYVNPEKASPGGPGGPGAPPGPGQVLPPFLQDQMKLSPEQKKTLDGLQKEIDGRLEKALTEGQRTQLKESMGRGGFGGFPQPGQVMSMSTQAMLKPTPEQKTELAALQKDVDAKLEALLNGDQKKQFKEMRDNFGRGGPGGGPGGPPGFNGPPGGAGVFRAYRYGKDYPGLVGKDLTPGKTIEEMQPKEPETKGAPEKKEQDKT